jgi:hypothetical protein
MSGANVRGAKPAVDIRTLNTRRDPATGIVTKKSLVAIRVPLMLGTDIKIGARVQQTQANGVTLAITHPPMVLTKEATVPPFAAGSVCNELTMGFPPGGTEQWVAWTGRLPGQGAVNKLDLKTVLTIDGNAIPTSEFQLVPMLMTNRGTPFKPVAPAAGHYLIDTSIIPGDDVDDIPVAPAPAKAKAKKPKKQTKKKTKKKSTPKKHR